MSAEKENLFFAWFKQFRVGPLSATILGTLGVLGVLIPIFSQRYSDARLEIVDIAINDSDHSNVAVLEVKLRNVGTKVAFLKRAEFRVRRLWKLSHGVQMSARPVTETYDVKLFPAPTPFVKEIAISQEIPGNATDRVQFRLLHGDESGATFVYCLSLALKFNGGTKTIVTDNVFFIAQDGPNWNPNKFDAIGNQISRRTLRPPLTETELNDKFREAHKLNLIALSQIRSEEGIRSPRLLKIMESIR